MLPIRARFRRVFSAEIPIAARGISQVTYQGKNQGVTRSNAPRVASVVRTSVCVVGERQSQSIVNSKVLLNTAILIAFQILRCRKIEKKRALKPEAGFPWALTHSSRARKTEPEAEVAAGVVVKLLIISERCQPNQKGA